MQKIGFGDYAILERVANGEKVRHYETLWSIQDAGLAIKHGDYLDLTDRGRTYLKNNKKPSFPHSRMERARIQRADSWIDS